MREPGAYRYTIGYRSVSFLRQNQRKCNVTEQTAPVGAAPQIAIQHPVPGNKKAPHMERSKAVFHNEHALAARPAGKEMTLGCQIVFFFTIFPHSQGSFLFTLGI